jgi:hypothetical protein
MADKENHNASLQIFDLVENNLPDEDNYENTNPINGAEYFLWMIGIGTGIFLLRYIYLLLF